MAMTYTVSLGSESRSGLAGDAAMAFAEELNSRHGGVPSIVPDAVAQVRAGDVDATARARINAQQAALVAAGVTGVGFAGEGGTGDQFYANGTRMMSIGYETQAGRKAEHDRGMTVRDAADALAREVREERREDVTMSAADAASSLTVNGKVSIAGYAIGEQAIRGMLARLESPSLSYVLGLRERIATNLARGDEGMGQVRADKVTMAAVLERELRAAPDTALKFRFRGAQKDCFAVVSPGYSPADAPEVLARSLDGLPQDARGEWSYDATSTSWELRASVWTPTPVEEQAVGEPFRGYVSLRARDNGTSSFRGGGGIEILRCLNASVYVADGVQASRVHRGRILIDIASVLDVAKRSIDTLCKVWGTARADVVEVPSGLTLEDAIPGFWRHLLRDRSSELVGVLRGRSETHARGLARATMSERSQYARGSDAVTRADFAQGWTKYIQNQDRGTRLDAEQAIATWLAKPRTMACEADRG